MDDKIIISGYIDNTVLQLFPNMGLVIYDSVSKLSESVEAGPVVADKIYISEDIIKYNPNSVFTKLVEVYKSPFLKVEEIVFIVPPSSEMLERIEFLIKNDRLGKVQIVKGQVTKEFILSVIRGDASANKNKMTRKEVIRHRRGDYIREQRSSSQFKTTDKFVTETEALSKVGKYEEIEREETQVFDTSTICELIQITGINELTTATFSLILAQFMSGYGRTVLIETDVTYFTTSYLVSQSKIKALNLKLSDFYQDPLSMVRAIQESEENLIVITSDSSAKMKNYRPYSIIHSLYNMLKTQLSYFLIPAKMEELLPSMRTIVVMDNDLISIIKTASTIPATSIENMQFVCIHCNKKYLAITDSSIISSFIFEITGATVEVPIYGIDNLNLEGGDVYDLYRYVEGNVKQNPNV